MRKILNVRCVFKCHLMLYTSIALFIMYTLNYEHLNKQIPAAEIPLGNLETNSVTSRNVTQVRYVNRTHVIYNLTVKQRHGPGENGSGVSFPDGTFVADELNELKIKRREHGFNTYISDVISLHRQIPDMRPRQCKTIGYPDNLPPVSVVIIFRDEWPSILLRTAYSVLETTPAHLIKEIILVDDGSIHKDLKSKVEIHVAAVEKMKLVRNEEPLGLMLARQKGIEAATAEYFVVLDGHMEVGRGWLEPLIYRLVQEPRSLLSSHIGAILQDNLKINIDDPRNEFVFDTQFPFFDHITLDQIWAWYSNRYRRERNHSVAPIPYGTIQGMMTVMRKDFFMQLGGFDPGMQIWGSEQIELSVKVWLCGGRVEMVPCSKVAHMYRVTPWGRRRSNTDFHALNKLRVFEVWMDGQYKDTLKDYMKNKKVDTGDLAPRHQLRSKNKCKPYQYFVDKMKNMSDVFIPEKLQARGQILNNMTMKCLAYFNLEDYDKGLSMQKCNINSYGNQFFILTQKSQIRSTAGTLVYVQFMGRNSTKVTAKHTTNNWFNGASTWRYTIAGTLVNIVTGRCLTLANTNRVSLEECGSGQDQIWQWNRII